MFTISINNILNFKNFTLSLNELNIIEGKSKSGKSNLAKLITIVINYLYEYSSGILKNKSLNSIKQIINTIYEYAKSIGFFENNFFKEMYEHLKMPDEFKTLINQYTNKKEFLNQLFEIKKINNWNDFTIWCHQNWKKENLTVWLKKINVTNDNLKFENFKLLNQHISIDHIHNWKNKLNYFHQLHQLLIKLSYELDIMYENIQSKNWKGTQLGNLKLLNKLVNYFSINSYYNNYIKINTTNCLINVNNINEKGRITITSKILNINCEINISYINSKLYLDHKISKFNYNDFKIIKVFNITNLSDYYYDFFIFNKFKTKDLLANFIYQHKNNANNNKWLPANSYDLINMSKIKNNIAIPWESLSSSEKNEIILFKLSQLNFFQKNYLIIFDTIDNQKQNIDFLLNIMKKNHCKYIFLTKNKMIINEIINSYQKIKMSSNKISIKNLTI